MQRFITQLFKLSENKTTISRECLAGLTTFLTMSYIIFVNPLILGASGMDKGAVYVATCLVIIIASVLLGLIANYPIAIAPAMGIVSFFAYTVVLGSGYSWQQALGMVFISGVIFFIITLTKARMWIVESMPEHINLAITVGLGMFIALIALENAEIIIKPSGKTLLAIGHLGSGPSILFFLGFFIIVALDHFRIHGGLIISIFIITLISLLLGMSQFHGFFSLPPSIAPTFLALDLKGALQYQSLPIIFTFLLAAFFDSTGALVGLLRHSLFRQDPRRVQRTSRALMAESIGTISGSLLGTAPTSPYMESAAGIEAGGRTGLVAIVVALLFLLVLFLSPLAMSIPAYAVAPALFYVGILMMRNITLFNVQDLTDFIPCILIVVMIPFSFSIADGIGMGIIAYVILKSITGKRKELNLMLLFIAAIFLGYFIFLLH